MDTNEREKTKRNREWTQINADGREPTRTDTRVWGRMGGTPTASNERGKAADRRERTRMDANRREWARIPVRGAVPAVR